MTGPADAVVVRDGRHYDRHGYLLTHTQRIFSPFGPFDGRQVAETRDGRPYAPEYRFRITVRYTDARLHGDAATDASLLHAEAWMHCPCSLRILFQYGDTLLRAEAAADEHSLYCGLEVTA